MLVLALEGWWPEGLGRQRGEQESMWNGYWWVWRRVMTLDTVWVMMVRDRVSSYRCEHRNPPFSSLDLSPVCDSCDSVCYCLAPEKPVR